MSKDIDCLYGSGEDSCDIIEADESGTNEKVSEFTSETEGRADKAVAVSEDISRSLAVKLIESGRVLLNGRKCEKNDRVNVGDRVSICYPAPTPDRVEPEDIPLDIIYEDGDIIVINKPKGMIVHPATGIYTGTLVNALLYHCRGSLSGIGGVIRPGIVHRIDKDTSGLLVIAKNDSAHLSLSEQIKHHGVSRVYHALAVGNIKEDSGTIDRPIGRHPVDRKRMAVIFDINARAREAITHFNVIERYSVGQQRFTYVICQLETGRTHQIRVHMSSVGHPLMGDTVYGGGKTKFEAQNSAFISGQCLHAKRLELTHPRTGERMTFECDIETGMKKLIEKLRNFNEES